MSPYDKEPIACEGCEKLQQELNEMEERLDRERRYSDALRTDHALLKKERDDAIHAALIERKRAEKAEAEVERLRAMVGAMRDE